MLLLLLVSLLWAPSFPLVKQLGLHPDLLSALRLTLAALAFAPWLGRLERARRLHLLVLGAVQLGAMYVLVHRSYAYLEGHEVALFTVLTPVWVALVDGVAAGRLGGRPFLAAVLAIVGAFLLRGERFPLSAEGLRAFTAGGGKLHGFALVQAANVCFALGQVVYRRLAAQRPLDHVGAFAWAYLGAAAVALVAAAASVPAEAVRGLADASPRTLGTVLYLGLVPTALGFHLWNRGATQVSAGFLAAANDLKVPLAVGVALLVFDEPADPVRLAAASAFIVVALVVGRGERA